MPRSSPTPSFLISSLLVFVAAMLAGASCPSVGVFPSARSAGAGVESPSNPLAGGTPADTARTIRLRAVGDVMLGTDFPSPRYLPPPTQGSILGAVADWLRDADLTVANLEGPFLDGGRSSKCGTASTSCYAFRTPTRYGAWLTDVGLDLASIANNHAMDFESDDPRLDGRQSTIRLLDSLGIAWSGPPGTFASVSVRGTTVAMAAYHAFDHSNHLNDEPAAARFVARLAEDHDIVVVFFHGGAEGGATRVPRGRETFLGEDRGDLRLFARTVIDAGADLVIGAGPHVPRGLEVYRGRLVAYSLGNFATYGRFTIRGNTALAPVLDVELAPDGAFVAGRILSARQVGEGVPQPDDTGAAAALMAELSAQDFPESEAEVRRDGTILLRGAAGR